MDSILNFLQNDLMSLPKKVLFLHGAFNLGGIETHILRLAEELHGRGVEVHILLLTLRYDQKLIDELSKFSVIQFAPNILKNPSSSFKGNLQLMSVMPLKEGAIDELLSGVDCIHICGVWSLVFYCKHIRQKAMQTKVVCGVYHQNEFNFRSIHPSFFQKQLFNLVNDSIPAESMLFFNEKSVDMAVDLYGKKYYGSQVFPIGIKFNATSIDPKKNHQSRKIISVGRITSFKTYNFKMVEIFDQILKIDPSFEYHIYGDGEQFSELKQFIEMKKMGNSIFLHGSLPYQDFEKVIGDAFIFVGSGTALLEAAAMGIPAVIGIESDTEGLTYGLLNKLQGYSYHEKGLSFALESFVKCINDIALLDASGYADISLKSKARASEFSIEEFVDLYFSYLNKNLLLPVENIDLNMPKYLFGTATCFALGRLDEKKLFSARY